MTGRLAGPARRPLGPVSDAAAGARVPAARLRQVASALAGGRWRAAVPSKDTDLASADVTLVAHRLAALDEPAAEILALRDELAEATGKAAQLTYEDLVLLNPLDVDPRTLTRGATAGYERRFYGRHVEIEAALREATRLTAGVAGRDVAHPVAARAALLEAGARVREARDTMRLAGSEMPRDEFGAIRTALMAGLPEGAPGPSGRFSMAIPVLETIVGGDAAWTDERRDELRRLQHLFPREGRRELAEAARQAAGGFSLLDAARASAAGVVDAALQLALAIYDFRASHRGAVHRLIPASSEPVAGTGGVTDLRAYLADRQCPPYLAALDHLSHDTRSEPSCFPATSASTTSP